MNNPTTLTYTSLNTTYEYFNRELFSGMLPPCLITMQRHKGATGFSPENVLQIRQILKMLPMKSPSTRCISRHAILRIAIRNSSEILSTLAHEMTHLWQHHFGSPPRKGYHDREWAGKMLEIGLIPTDTGQIGGKETGQKMSHLIAEDGRFASAVAALLQEHPATLYHDRSSEQDPVRKKKAASKTKYTCPVWPQCLGKTGRATYLR